jgi:hypothetical protein
MCITLTTAGAEYDILQVMLPISSPEVTCIRRLLPIPVDDMQAMDVSDVHPVASHDVNPARRRAVCHWLKLEPTTVRLNEPVDPALMVRLPCSAITAPSTVQICVTLPDDPSPAVTASRLLPDGEAFPALHLNTVSDSQRVFSHSEWPSLALTLDAKDPKLDPSTVTLDDPVPALFMYSFVVFHIVPSTALHSQPQLKFHGEIVIANPVLLQEQLEDEHAKTMGIMLTDPSDTFKDWFRALDTFTEYAREALNVEFQDTTICVL